MYEDFYADAAHAEDDDDRAHWTRLGELDMRTGRLIR
jgi:hypothetical protein